jgi:hypothetical protein
LHLLKFLLMISVSAASLNEEKYSPNNPPPQTGWESALKFFKNDANNSTRAPTSSVYSDASYDQYLSLDNTIVLNSELSSSLEPEGRWGLNLGYVWDHSRWLSQGIYLQYFDHQIEKKYSLMTGIIFPGIETQFPIYLKANAGLGYFRGDFDNDTLTVDYSAAVGLRLFSQNRFLFHLEFGSQNYHRLLRKSYTNSWVLSSGLAFIF